MHDQLIINPPRFEIIYFDAMWNELTSTTAFTTLIWRPSALELGDAEIHMAKQDFPQVKNAQYAIVRDLKKKDAQGRPEVWKQTLIIEGMHIDQSNRTASARGHMLEKALGNLTVRRLVTYSGRVGNVMHQLVKEFAIDNNEPIFKLIPGTVGVDLGSRITADQPRGEYLLDRLYAMGNPEHVYFRLYYDYYIDAVRFEVWKGKDRTSDQTENPPAIFTEGRGSDVTSSEYNLDESDYKNFAVVLGQDSGTDREEVEVDIRPQGAYPHRETQRILTVDARDMQQEEGEPREHYRQRLYQRGIEKLAEYKIIEGVTATINPSAGLLFPEDFDYGDICEYQDPEAGLVVLQPITSLVITVQDGVYSVDPIFGEEALTIKKRIEREVR